MESNTKGIFLKGLVKIVEQEKGPKGLKELENFFGDIKFSGFKDYPFSVERKLNQAVIKVLWGKETPEAWIKLGRIGFRSYIDNPLGKTMFSLFGNNIKSLALMLGKVFDTVTSGYKVKVEDLGPQKLSVIIDNCSDEREYWVGMFEAGIAYFGSQPFVEAKTLGENKYQFFISWK